MRFFPCSLDRWHWNPIQVGIYVVVQIYPWFKFYFLLVLVMEMYDNEFETKQNKNLNSWIKLNHNIVKVLQSGESSLALRNALNQCILIKSLNV